MNEYRRMSDYDSSILGTSLLETGCTETAAHMHLWSGDTKAIVRRAIDKAQLTDWVVNLANAVSR